MLTIKRCWLLYEAIIIAAIFGQHLRINIPSDRQLPYMTIGAIVITARLYTLDTDK